MFSQSLQIYVDLEQVGEENTIPKTHDDSVLVVCLFECHTTGIQ